MTLLNRLLIAWFFLIANLSVAQEYLLQQFELAKDLYEKEKFYDAITEFKRLRFFDEKKVYDFQTNKFIALCYKEGGKFDEAVRYFTLAEINPENNEELFEIKIEIIRSNILRRTVNNAHKLLDEIGDDERWKDNKPDISYWQGWAYIFEDKWDKAAEQFYQISPDHELKILCEKTHDKKYSIEFAKIISIILPGAGQFYTGNYVSGLLSLGWCALWGYISVDAIVEDRIFDGLAVANFLWLRFYRGNLENAEKFAMEKNIQITNESLYYLQNNYSGLKP